MKKNVELLRDFRDLMELSKYHSKWETGNGIVMVFRFDKQKLNEKKSEIAEMLKEIGISSSSSVSLRELTTLKDGTVWNPLLTIEDFWVLDLLVASADACEFIENNESIKKANLKKIGHKNSVLISSIGRSVTNTDEEWLAEMRKKIIDKMSFVVNSSIIEQASISNDKNEEEIKKQALKNKVFSLFEKRK